MNQRNGSDDCDVYIGIMEGPFDPAVAAVRGGEVVAYSEEERHIRYKHAYGVYPTRALEYCLKAAGASLDQVAAIAVNTNTQAYSDGTMEAFYRKMRKDWPVDQPTIAWQEGSLRSLNTDAVRNRHHKQWRQMFGDIEFPPIKAVPHHFAHAFHAGMQSPFDRALCLTIDGSGDQHTTVIWEMNGDILEPLREICMPHSLGWVYAAFTEYLGFAAYDGEYKVMGLAAYGRQSNELDAKLDRIVQTAPDCDFSVDPTFIHYGSHHYSGRFTDKLVELLGRPPRLPDEDTDSWHEDIAFAVQNKIERTVEALVIAAVRETGIRTVCVGGGVGLNVKMNSRLFQHPEIDNLFVQPLCSDSGAAIGAALAASFEVEGTRPAPLKTLALGPEESDDSIEKALQLAQIPYERPDDICEAVADELASGRIVGWFQGRMEAGPRALGQRSILADPRHIASRDKVNSIIKYREYWRPFCPSMSAEAADRYFDDCADAPFMIVSFPANERLHRDAPAIVHVDGTSRVQLVNKDVLPRFHALLAAFEERTGLPVLLNTSFNVRGEPIVCTIRDAVRTFWSTGLDVLAAGDLIVRKSALVGADHGG